MKRTARGGVQRRRKAFAEMAQCGIRNHSTRRRSTLRLPKVTWRYQQKLNAGNRNAHPPCQRGRREDKCARGERHSGGKKNHCALVLRLVMAIPMQVKPLVQRGSDFRRTEHEHQRHSDRDHEHAKARCRRLRVGGAGDHVRWWNVVTIQNASS